MTNSVFGLVTRYATALALALLLGGCAGNQEQQTLQGSVDAAYERAQNSIRSGNYRQAIAVLQAIQSRFPFTQAGKQSQLDLLYCYYKNGDPERAIDGADQFIRENPTHPRVDYALYIKGLTYFDEDPGKLATMLGSDRSRRPPAEDRLAFQTFKRLVERYPSSEWGTDAEQRMRFLRERLARYENHVARYYLTRGAYIAAINRAKNSLEEFNGTEANRESLSILRDSYVALGLDELAADTQRVLAQN